MIMLRTANAKLYNTYVVSQAAYCSCSGAFVLQTKRAYCLYTAG